MAFLHLDIAIIVCIFITIVRSNSTFLADLWTQSYIRQHNITISPYSSDLKKSVTTKTKSTTNENPTSLDIIQLLELFTSENCFACVSNHQNVNFKSQYLPIATRRPELAFISMNEYQNSVYYRRGTRQDLLVPLGFESTVNKSVVWLENSTSCKLSQYLNNPSWGEPAVDFCYRINHLTYSAKSKPWNCKLDINLFTPYILLENLASVNIFNINIFENKFNLVPSVNSLDITILVDVEKRTIEYTSLLTKWIKNKYSRSPNFDLYGYSVFHSINLVAYTKVVAKSIHEVHSRIKYISVLKRCHTCLFSRNSFKQDLQFPPIKSLDSNSNKQFINNLILVAFPTPQEQLVWDSVLLGLYGEGEAIQRHIGLCTNHYYKRKTLAKGIFQSPLERLAHSTAYVLQSIMKNNSYGLLGNLRCENGKVKPGIIGNLSKSLYGDNVFNSPFMLYWKSGQSFTPNVKTEMIWLQNRLSTLRIVSCGQKSSSPFPFASLVNVYSFNAWITGIFFTLLLSVATWRIYNFSYTIVDTIAMALKYLVEQGDSFTPDMCKVIHMRILISGFLLGGVVLSNAYKNNNVYNMITPRSPVLYDTLEELVKDNFTIYTRMKYMATWPLSFIPNRTVLIVNKHSVTMTGFRLSYSEVNLAITAMPAGCDSKPLETLQNRSMIYPNALIFLRSIVDQFHNLYLKSKGKDNMVLNKKFREIVYRMDEDILLEELKKCSKTAVVLPKYMAYNFMDELQRNNIPYGNVGSEIFKEVNIVFNLDRLVPPFLIRRISGVEASGVIEWWKRFVGKEYLPRRFTPKVVKSATMYGNILVIFIVLLGGLSISCLMFVVEMLPLLCRRIWGKVSDSQTVKFVVSSVGKLLILIYKRVN